ncbi:MAG TPA: hypothetical protein VFN53_09225 [Acidobacteriaceae bacterium]|nr:hypothetical protein [Acidobacteriaceae bacterium]
MAPENSNLDQNPCADPPCAPANDTRVEQSEAEKAEEARKIRRLQTMMNMVISVISQDESLTVEEASELIGNSERTALNMFPGKELAYNLIYRPRLQRLMMERFRLQ